ncbi:MAG: hypothetical protein U7127_31120 (plasmid) [Phormidium sp.]
MIYHQNLAIPTFRQTGTSPSFAVSSTLPEEISVEFGWEVADE